MYIKRTRQNLKIKHIIQRSIYTYNEYYYSILQSYAQAFNRVIDHHQAKKLELKLQKRKNKYYQNKNHSTP